MWGQKSIMHYAPAIYVFFSSFLERERSREREITFRVGTYAQVEFVNARTPVKGILTKS
jgi:hypothetical protein